MASVFLNRLALAVLALALALPGSGAARDSKKAREARVEQERQEQARQAAERKQWEANEREIRWRESEERRSRESFVIVAACILGVLGFVGLIAYWLNSREKREAEECERLRGVYQRMLDMLAKHPSVSDVREACLKAGRAYYALALPDSYDVDRHGNIFNHKDNTAGRELRIQSDMQARTGNVAVTGTFADHVADLEDSLDESLCELEALAEQHGLPVRDVTTAENYAVYQQWKASKSTRPVGQGTARPERASQPQRSLPAAHYAHYKCAPCNFTFVRRPGDNVCPQCHRPAEDAA